MDQRGATRLVLDQLTGIELMDQILQEEWRPVVGWETWCEVSNHGRVRSLDRIVPCNGGARKITGRVLKAVAASHGYLTITIRGKQAAGPKVGALVHVLVLEAFVGPRPEGADACHGDGNKLNNHVSNLRWDTRTANRADQVLHGVAAIGERNGHALLTEDDVRQIRTLRSTRLLTFEQIGELFGVSRTTAQDAVAGRTWRHVE